MENELKRVECWTGFQARNYDEKRDDDGTFYYADEVDEALASLRARLEAAEIEREQVEAALAGRIAAASRPLVDGVAALVSERDACKRQMGIECEAKHAVMRERDAALRELAEFKEVCAKRDADVLTALDYEGADSTPLHAAHVRLSELLGAKRQRDAANALLRSVEWNGHPCGGLSTCVVCGHDIEHGHSEGCELGRHLAASPSPLASPEGDGAGRECERPMDLIERSRADLDLMDYEGARRAQEVIHIYVCPNERCSGGLIMDGRGGVLGRCKVCNPRRAQGGDSNAEGSGA